MYRLLIVDDEPAIVDGLMQHFQEMEEFEVDLCKAYSAFDALELVKKTKIDVVLSDIRMPGKTGLQLMDEILFYWPACRIIFLTGYSEFDYVYTAIQKNVDNYILKTEGLDAISAAVKQAVYRIEEESRNRMLVETAEQQMLLMEPLLKKELFEALLSGETASDLFANRRFSEVDLNVRVEFPLFLLMGTVDGWPGEVSYTSKLNTLDAVMDMLASHLPSLFLAEGFASDHSILVWFIQLDPNADRFKDGNGRTEWSGIANYLKGILESVQNRCQDRFGVSLSFAVSKEAVEWDGMHKQFETLKNVLKRTRVLGQTMSILDTGIFEDFPKLLHSLEKHNADGDERTEKQQLEKGKDLLIERVHRYIQDHLGGDLSLARIAEWVYFNPSYLSRFYKQATGRKLSDYINSCKSEAAAAMLENMQLKVNEIASQLGFESPSYFTAFFKKMTGRTPQEYREQYIQKTRR